MPLTISSFFIYKSCIFYLVIPILFFFLGWLRLGIGLALSVLLLLASFFFLKNIKTSATNDESIILSKEYYIAFVILFLFLLSTGNTGFVGSWGSDIPWRNAIYQDLIRESWPVIYDYSHSMLCYYMAFWLVPAEITALLGLNETGGNVVLFIWMYIGLLLIFFLLCIVLKPKKEQVTLVTVIFLFFSGINIIGMLLRNLFFEPTTLIADFPGRLCWSFAEFNVHGTDIIFIIRDTYLNIADVYNQFFAIAISTLLFYRFRNNVNFYAYIGLLVLPYSPIGFIGLFVVEVFEFALNTIKNRESNGTKNIKDCFSNINVFSSLSLVPVFYLYYSMNLHSAALKTGHAASNSFLYIPWNQFAAWESFIIFIILLLYYFFYFLIYALFIYDTYKKDSIFWAILFCLIVFPFFKIGSTADFNFNATTCPYFILCILIIKYLIQVLTTKSIKTKDIILIFFLSLAMLTPIIQITTSFRCAYLNHSISSKWIPWSKELQKDSFKDKNIQGFRNFLAEGYNERPFYLYVSKR